MKLSIECERETDGRWIAEIAQIPGAMAYGATRASRVLAALLRIGWSIKRQSGSHRVLSKDGSSDFVFAFHDGEEIGPRMLARLAEHTGIRPTGLSLPGRRPLRGQEVDVASRGRRLTVKALPRL